MAVDGGARQICPDCGSPLVPCKCEDDRRSVPGSTLKTRTRLSAKPFSKKYDGTGERYGALFRFVRDMKCWLSIEGYRGPGHEWCRDGVQGGSTAHHTGRKDEEGLVPGCGAAHDLYAGLGGRSTRKAFRAWLDSKGLSIERVGLLYVAKANEAVEDVGP